MSFPTTSPLAAAADVDVADRMSIPGALLALTKPRIAFMSVVTAMVAYGTARPESSVTLATLVGTALSAGGVLSLNQWWERNLDARMRRTQGRPLPQMRLTPATALGWSLALCVAGVLLLALAVNLNAAGLAALTIVTYGLAYTPLKQRTRWATEVGAISGALPALLGNAAAGHLWAGPGVALATMLLFWQMPHFFAIGWRHREDYRAAGFMLRPAIDSSGANTAWWSFGYAVLLLPVSVVPWWMGAMGATYGVITLVAGMGFLFRAWGFVVSADRDFAARRLFRASLLYLLIFLIALLFDWVPAWSVSAGVP
ncbi:MAG: heme o synthase [Opitutaceae bacterium]|nr:heme o synthase [Opitutaceae bacterium]